VREKKKKFYPQIQGVTLTILLALMALRSSGRLGAWCGGWRRVSLVVDHFLHLLLLVTSSMQFDGGRGFLLVFVAGLLWESPPPACGLFTGHDLPLGMISRHHFELVRLFNEALVLIPIESRLEWGWISETWNLLT
jgi:hypothetical protein